MDAGHLDQGARARPTPPACEALKPIDLDIDKGEIFALLGPNGAGKTTLITIVCGIVTPSARHGRRSTATTSSATIARARRKIGLVPQELHTDAFETRDRRR